MRDEKAHAVVARSTFPSQNGQNTRGADHFWKLRCRTSARRCGAKHISKSKVLKTGGLGPLLEVEMSKKCTPLWREAHFEVKMHKTHHVRTTLGGSDEVQMSKKCTPLWREAHFQVKMCKTPFSDHFWKLRCRTSARRCGAKHISKSKVLKTGGLGPLLEVEMSKKCTPLWREAHFEVKMYKTHHVRTTFGGSDEVQMSKKCTPLWREAHFEVKMYKTYHARTTFGGSHEVQMSKKCTQLWREAHFEVNMLKTPFSDHFWRFRCRFASLHYITLHSTTLRSTTLHYITQHYNYNYTTTLHYNPLH